MKCPVGSEVEARAEKVLEPAVGAAWFGAGWKERVVRGRVLRADGNKVVVRWEHDAHAVESSHGARALTRVQSVPAPPAAAAPVAAGAAAAADAPPPPQSARPRRELARARVAAAAASAAYSDDDEEFEQENPANPEYDESDEDEARQERNMELAEARANEEAVQLADAVTTVAVHGRVWKLLDANAHIFDKEVPPFPEDVCFPAHVRNRVGTSASGAHDPYEAFCAVFTDDVRNFIVENVNRDKAHIDHDDLLRFFGILLYMSENRITGDRRRLWAECDAAKDPHQVLGWPDLGRFLSRDKFERILKNALGGGEPPHDLWERPRRLIELFNASARIARAGPVLTCDESMCPSYAQETYKAAYDAGHRRPGAVAPKQYVKEKPRPLGWLALLHRHLLR